MARGRMLSKSISLSEQVNDLSDNAQLLFTWMIAHGDDQGRLLGNPNNIKGRVAPLKRWSEPLIFKYLVEMANEDLIFFWFQGGNFFIQFIKWYDHQTLQTDRITPSKYPAFDPKTAKSISKLEDLEKLWKQDGYKKETQYNLKEVNIREYNINQISRFLKDLRRSLTPSRKKGVVENGSKPARQEKHFNYMISIISLYARIKGIDTSDPEIWQSIIDRNARAARKLKAYPFERIEETMKWLENYADFKWTLETVYKFIDEDLEKLAAKKSALGRI